MSRARWITLEGNVTLVDFRRGYRSLELPKPPRTVCGRRSRRRAIRGAVWSPHDIGYVRPIGFSYQLQRPVTDIPGPIVLPFPNCAAGGIKTLGSVCEAPTFCLPKTP